MDSHLISICIPAYNCGDYITATLNCLCAQSYSPIEIIVVNDGSTDSTSAMIRAVDDPRIVYIDAKNGGASKARNTAYARSSGRYIIFFDADDYIEPDFVETQVNAITANPGCVVMSGWGRFYNNDPGTIKRIDIPFTEASFETWITTYWHNCNPMTTPGRTIIPREFVDEAGGWNEDLSLNDDLEFYTKIFLKAKKIVFNNKAIFYYRSGIQGLSTKKGSGAYLSYYNSILSATGMALGTYGYQTKIMQSCANLWQMFIYDVYPFETQLVESAKAQVKALGGATYNFPAGGYTRSMAAIIGWKATKRIKLALNA